MCRGTGLLRWEVDGTSSAGLARHPPKAEQQGTPHHGCFTGPCCCGARVRMARARVLALRNVLAIRRMVVHHRRQHRTAPISDRSSGVVLAAANDIPRTISREHGLIEPRCSVTLARAPHPRNGGAANPARTWGMRYLGVSVADSHSRMSPENSGGSNPHPHQEGACLRKLLRARQRTDLPSLAPNTPVEHDPHRTPRRSPSTAPARPRCHTGPCPS
jgi:hypothetical protein